MRTGNCLFLVVEEIEKAIEHGILIPGDSMRKKHMYLGLSILWMLVIFWFSAQVATTSQGYSDQILRSLEEVFHINLLHTTTILGDLASFVIRKVAHISEYAILGMLLFFVLREYEVKHPILKAFLLGVLYACSDEFHQLFVEGRSGQLLDVGIDSIGILLGLSIQQGLLRLGNMYKKYRLHS